jgi:hypothetical protein
MDSWRVNPVFAESFSYIASHRTFLQKASNPPNPPQCLCGGLLKSVISLESLKIERGFHA